MKPRQFNFYESQDYMDSPMTVMSASTVGTNRDSEIMSPAAKNLGLSTPMLQAFSEEDMGKAYGRSNVGMFQEDVMRNFPLEVEDAERVNKAAKAENIELIKKKLAETERMNLQKVGCFSCVFSTKKLSKNVYLDDE